MFAQSAGWIQPRLILSSLARKTNTAFSPLLRTDTMTGRGSSPVAHGCDLAAKRESCSSGFSTRPQQSTSAGGDDGNISLCHPSVRPANNLAAEAAGGGVDSTNDNTHQHGDDDDGGSGDDDWFKIVDVDIAESAGQGGGGGATPTTPSTTTPTGTKTAAPPAAAKQAAGAGKNQRLPAFNFSFAMGGWLMFYTFGVAKCLLDHGLHNVRPTEQSVIGSSAGSLAAAALVLEADIDKASNERSFVSGQTPRAMHIWSGTLLRLSCKRELPGFCVKFVGTIILLANFREAAYENMLRIICQHVTKLRGWEITCTMCVLKAADAP